MSGPSSQEAFALWTPKNSRERLRVGLGEWEGRPMLDVRAYALTPEGPAPTRKGVTISLAHAPALAAALQEALSEARARGLLEPDAGG
jgi:hypothetical protein